MIFWHVRCHLHFLANMAQERLSFDVQKPMAAFFYQAMRPLLPAQKNRA